MICNRLNRFFEDKDPLFPTFRPGSLDKNTMITDPTMNLFYIIRIDINIRAFDHETVLHLAAQSEAIWKEDKDKVSIL